MHCNQQSLIDWSTYNHYSELSKEFNLNGCKDKSFFGQFKLVPLHLLRMIIGTVIFKYIKFYKNKILILMAFGILILSSYQQIQTLIIAFSVISTFFAKALVLQPPSKKNIFGILGDCSKMMFSIFSIPLCVISKLAKGSFSCKSYPAEIRIISGLKF